MKIAALLPLVILLAGCAAPEGTPGAKASSGAPSGPAGTTQAGSGPNTGSILASVVTSELMPVEKAQVLISGTSLTAFTDEAGAARFDDLAPGSYTVLAAKPGYKVRPERGRAVEVLAGEVVEARLEMNAAPVVSKNDFYHTTWPYSGFLTCSFQASPVVAQSCGRQTVLSDPNGKSLHAWTTDSLLVQSIVLEAQWQPNQGLLPFQLDFKAYRGRTCSATACSLNDPIFSGQGSSPIHFIMREDSAGNLTRRLGSDPATYPREHYAEMLVYCPSGRCPASVVIQQKYDAWVTAFYGEQAPEGWSIIPK
jgi:hypothetical protein